MPPSAQPKSEIQRLIEAEAVRQGLSPALLVAIATQESWLNPNAVGDRGKSLGLFQLQRAAAIDAGIDPNRRGELGENIRGGVSYFKQQLRKEGGNVERALSRYNRGTPTYQGIGDPHYVENVLSKVQGGVPRAQLAQVEAPAQPARRTLASRVTGMLSPRSAEAAAVAPQPVAQQRLEAINQRLGGAPAAQPAAPPETRLEAINRRLATPPAAGAPAAQPAATPPPAAAAGGEIPAQPDAPPSLLERLGRAAEIAGRGTLGGQVYSLVQPALQAQYGEQFERLPQLGAAGAISTGGAMLGTAAGTLAAPLAGPLAPAMPLVGEMAGSYLGRQLNVGLGLEEPGTLGDVLSVAVPGAMGARGALQGVRAGLRPGAVPPGTEQLAQEAAQRGVPLTYGEVSGSPMARRAETLLEQVPLAGTSGFRRRQQQAVTTAAQAETAARQQVMQEVPWQGLAEVQQAAQQGNRQAQQVLREINASGEDWSRIVQASGNLRALRMRQIGNQLYGEVDRLAQGLGPVAPERTVRVVDDVLGDLRGAVLPDEPTIGTLEQMRESLTTQPRTYQQMRQFMSDLGDIVSDYYRGKNAIIGAKGVGSFTRIRTALRDDLDGFVEQSGVPALAAANRRANRFYQRQVIPYEDSQLARALTSERPDEIYAQFIQRGHRDRAQNFYRALEPRGRAAVQYGMVSEAMEKGLHPTTGHFSPARFAGELERIESARGVFFRGEEAQRLDGLLRVMRAAERAGAFTENPPTGQRVIGSMLGTGAVISPVTTAKVAAASAGLTWLLTSRPGSSLLLRAHRTGQDTLGMEQLLREIGVQGARIMATEAGEGLQEGRQITVEPGRVQRPGGP